MKHNAAQIVRTSLLICGLVIGTGTAGFSQDAPIMDIPNKVPDVIFDWSANSLRTMNPVFMKRNLKNLPPNLKVDPRETQKGKFSEWLSEQDETIKHAWEKSDELWPQFETPYPHITSKKDGIPNDFMSWFLNNRVPGTMALQSPDLDKLKAYKGFLQKKYGYYNG